MDDDNIRELLVMTMCAGALGIAGAEAVRFGFDRIVMRRVLSGSKFSIQISDFTHSAISAFILILTSYEKAVLLWSGMRFIFFLLTFILCILFSRIFSTSAPSPFYPLQKHWKKIIRVSQKPQRGRKPQPGWKIFFKMVAIYLQLAWPFLLGQLFGLLLSIEWMKVYWDGWLTSHHVNYLPLLDECMPCLNTNILLAFLLETLITISFLRSFDFIDDLEFSHGGANTLISSFLGRNVLKSAVIIFSMFLFIDVTGSFANPFQALAMQRHCISDVTEMARIVFVYVIGPFVGTVVYLFWWGNQKDRKESKRSA